MWETSKREKDRPSNTMAFLVHQIAQDTTQGSALWSFNPGSSIHCFRLPIREGPSYLPIPPDNDRASFQTSIVKGKSIRKCLMFSSLFLESTQRPSPCQALFWRTSHVKALLFNANYRNKLAFKEASHFHGVFHKQQIALNPSKNIALYPKPSVNSPTRLHNHTIESSPSLKTK